MAVSKRLRMEIFRRDNHTCRYCGAKAPNAEITIDHVVPTALGGSDDPSNLVTACADCNNGKTSVPPDAATVKQVSEDAFRWARAMEAAAEKMVGDREAVRAAFDQKWRAWNEGRTPVPRPEDWGLSVDGFLKAGLPLPILLDCVDISMRARHIKAADVFKYMCGVAWKEVGKLQDAAKTMVGNAESQSPESKPNADDWRRGRYDLARTMLETLGREEQEKCRWLAREWAENPEDAIECEVEAVQYAITEINYELGRLHTAIERLLGLHPEELVARCRKFATDLFRARADREPTEYDVLVHAVEKLVNRHQLEKAREHLDWLPQEERSEWIACATTLLGPHGKDPWYPHAIELKAAEYARRHKEDGWIPKRMCVVQGDHGAMCPGLAAGQVRFAACRTCAGTCVSHLVCDRHLKAITDGPEETEGGE